MVFALVRVLQQAAVTHATVAHVCPRAPCICLCQCMSLFATIAFYPRLRPLVAIRDVLDAVRASLAVHSRARTIYAGLKLLSSRPSQYKLLSHS
jgi:hypothetical protein